MVPTHTQQHLTTFELYLSHQPASVVRTEAVEDNTCGMNPCYYMRDGGQFLVSTSVTSLIAAAGSFERNEDFLPTKFFLHKHHKKAATLLKRAVSTAYGIARKSPLVARQASKVGKLIPEQTKATYLWNPHQAGYATARTVDKRISRLLPQQTISADGESRAAAPECTTPDAESHVRVAADVLRDEIHAIERRFPDRRHIILVGGKDSQLICLVPKLNPDNWMIFSAQPNFPIVEDWVRANGIEVGALYEHDGKNEETADEFKRKLLCSDLYSSPVHIRYLPTLARISREIGADCMFWLGSMPRGAAVFDGRSHERQLGPRAADEFTSRFFDYHLNQFPFWQGNIQQTYANYLQSPVFCPYYLPDFLAKVFFTLDPQRLESRDYRERLGELLHGHPVQWPTSNPGPVAYDYTNFLFDSYSHYLREIRKLVASENAAA